MRNVQNYKQPTINIQPAPLVPGSEAFSKEYVNVTGKAYGMASSFAQWIIAQDVALTTPSQVANRAQEILKGHGFPLPKGYQTVRKNKADFSALQVTIAESIQAVEQAAKRALSPVVAPAAPAAAPAAPSAPAAPEAVKLDDKGKARTALGDLKSAGITGKAELARIFSEMQQAVVEENLDKLSILILEGQKILVIAK